MERKQISVTLMTFKLIGGYILFGLVMSLIGGIVLKKIANISQLFGCDTNSVLSAIILFIINIIVIYGVVYFTSLISTKSIFKKYTIEPDKIGNLIRNIIIYFVIIILCYGFTTFSKMERKIDAVYNNYDTMYTLVYSNDEEKKTKEEIGRKFIIENVVMYVLLSCTVLAVIPANKKMLKNNL